MTQNLPQHLQKYQSRDIGQTLSQNLGTIAPPYVSIKSNRFTLIDAAGNEMPVPTFDPQIGVYLDGCIIDVGDHISRVYYDTEYDPSAQAYTPPACWSDNGVGPSISAAKPQSPTCAACPNAVWGSAISAQGKQIPACSMVQKIALMVPGVPQTVFLLRVPPNSHKHLRAYVELCRGNGAKIADLITRIYFDQTTQGTLLFKAVTWIDEPLAQLRQQAYDEKKTDNLVGRNDVPRPAGTLAAPVQAQQPTLASPGPVGYVPPGSTTGQPPIVQTATGPFAPIPASVVVTTSPVPFMTPPAASPTATGGPVVANPPASEGASPPRRRRRTQAEMAAANGQAGAPQVAPAPVAASQAAPQAPVAPFPHPGQAGAPGQFGIAQPQPSTANPEVASMLNDFFGKQG